MWTILSAIFRLLTGIASAIYGGEGINSVLLILPTRFISPTLRRHGARIGERVRFRAPLTIHNSETSSRAYYRNLSVGDDCYFGRELFIDIQEPVIIEDHVTVSHRVMILTHTDAGTSPLKDQVVKTTQSPVTIRRGAYVGAHVTILEGVEIGECAIIGAGALVNKSVPPYGVAVGVPARIIKTNSGAASSQPSPLIGEAAPS